MAERAWSGGDWTKTKMAGKWNDERSVSANFCVLPSKAHQPAATVESDLNKS